MTLTARTIAKERGVKLATASLILRNSCWREVNTISSPGVEIVEFNDLTIIPS